MKADLLAMSVFCVLSDNGQLFFLVVNEKNLFLRGAFMIFGLKLSNYSFNLVC